MCQETASFGATACGLHRHVFHQDTLFYETNHTLLRILATFPPKINDELAKLQKEYEKAIDGKEALKTKIDTLNKQRQTLENQINTAKSELAKLTKENEKIQSELDKAKTELEKLKKQLEEGKKAPKENPQPGPKPVDPTPVPPGEDPSPQVKDVPQDKVDTKITADTKAESKGLAKTGLSLGIITVLAALCIIGGTTAIRRRNN